MGLQLFGSVASFSLPELVRFLHETGKSGELSLEGGSGYRLQFLEGRIVDASTIDTRSDLPPSEIVVRALLQKKGSFVFYDPASDVRSRVDLDPLELIAEAERRLSEAEKIDREMIVIPPEQIPEGNLSSAEVSILLAAKGGRSISDLVESAPIDESSTTQHLGSLLQRGLLEPAPTDREEITEGTEETPGPAAPATEITAPREKMPAAPVPKQIEMACLVQEDSDNTTWPLFEETVTIGRSEKNTIQISDQSISSTHASLQKTEEGHLLEDQGSSNGTFVNGEKVTRKLLNDADRVRLGKVCLIYMVPAQVESSTGKPA